MLVCWVWMWAGKEPFYMTFTYWKWEFTEDETKGNNADFSPWAQISQMHLTFLVTVATKLNNCSPGFISMQLFHKHFVNPAGQAKFGHSLIFNPDEN